MYFNNLSCISLNYTISLVIKMQHNEEYSDTGLKRICVLQME